jgi:NitT/TauT family transport system ATP-binding protein
MMDPMINVDRLHLSFDGRTDVLADVSLKVEDGEFVSLVGPSGCGKTTLLNLCAGLVSRKLVGQGAIHVAGEAPREGSDKIAYHLARDSLLPWKTALENAAFGMQVRGVPTQEAQERARAMLAEVGLASFDSALPKALSHGMRQRTALARTFGLGTPVLLMDEPFGALDAQTKLQLEDLLLRLCEKHQHTVLFVTHDLAEAVAVSDRVVVMSSRPGRIVADVRIDLPRPRSIRDLQKDPRFHELYTELWSHLESGWTKHEG